MEIIAILSLILSAIYTFSFLYSRPIAAEAAPCTNLAGAVMRVVSDLSEMMAEIRVGDLDGVKVVVGQPAEVTVRRAAEVLAGLQEGDQVNFRPFRQLATLADGTAVKIKKDKP